MATTKEKWARRVAAWEASGLASEEFAKGRGFTGSGLRHWKHRLTRAPEVRLARVEVIPAARVERETPVVIRAGNVVFEVQRGFSRETLAAVLDVLEGR